MQGHIFSGLKQYRDAVFAQEAAVRVDNHYLMTDRLIPDQIHNYAHNSQWLAENLGYIGRVHDAIELCKNMLQLPRHPRYNNPAESRGTGYYGRMRLMQTLFNHEQWREAIALNAEGFSRSRQKMPTSRQSGLQLLAIASFNTSDLTAGKRWLADLNTLQDSERGKIKKDGQTR